MVKQILKKFQNILIYIVLCSDHSICILNLMIKKFFFQLIFLYLFFSKEVFAAESGGMPQLDPEFWVSQIFWLTLVFGTLYIVLSKLILPKISANLELRKSQIQENIEAADKQRKDSELKLKEYDDLNEECAKKLQDIEDERKRDLEMLKTYRNEMEEMKQIANPNVLFIS